MKLFKKGTKKSKQNAQNKSRSTILQSEIMKATPTQNDVLSERRSWFPNITKLLKGCGPNAVQEVPPSSTTTTRPRNFEPRGHDAASMNHQTTSDTEMVESKLRMIGVSAPESTTPVITIEPENNSTAIMTSHNTPQAAIADATSGSDAAQITAPVTTAPVTSVDVQGIPPSNEVTVTAVDNKSELETKIQTQGSTISASPKVGNKVEKPAGPALVGRPPRNSSRIPSARLIRSQSGVPRSSKPAIVLRSATENSNVSLHRRQQASQPFEFDTASLRLIVTDDDDDEMEKEQRSNSNFVPFDLSLPKTLDATMRAVSAMTVFSDGGDEDMVVEDDIDDNYDSFEDNGSIKSTTPPSTSPISVIDTCTPQNKDNLPLPVWMQQWAASTTETEGLENSESNAFETDPFKLQNRKSNELVQSFHGSDTVVSLQYSCSTASANDSVKSVVYIPSSPAPLQTDTTCDGQVHFKGWTAVTFGSDWVYNDDAKVPVDSLRYVQIISPNDNTDGNILFKFTRNDDEEGTVIAMSAATCRVMVQSVSSRKGNCLMLTDSNSCICILPVNLSNTTLLNQSTNSSSDTCDPFFAPFKKRFVQEEDTHFYAPDAQYDAVVHLRFLVDRVLAEARR